MLERNVQRVENTEKLYKTLKDKNNMQTNKLISKGSLQCKIMNANFSNHCSYKLSAACGEKLFVPGFTSGSLNGDIFSPRLREKFVNGLQDTRVT